MKTPWRTNRAKPAMVDQRHATDVRFEGHVVGTCVADLIVNDAVVMEPKAVSARNPAHAAECLNVLKARGCKLACCCASARLDFRSAA